MTSTAHVLFRRPRAPETRHGEKGRVLRLTPTDEDILIALGRYTYLRIDQLARLLPPTCPQPRSSRGRPDDRRYLQQRTKLLVEHGYIGRRYLFPDGPAVKAPQMFWLEPDGIAVVRDQLEQAVVPPPKTSEVEGISPSHLRHMLLANDLLILSELLCRDDLERIWLERFETERELARQGTPVVLRDGTRSLVKPDGFVDLRIDRGEEDEQVCICFELDRGSEYRKAWREKLARLLAFAAGPYQAWAGTSALLITVVATTGPARVARLVAQTEEFLRQQNATAVGAVFRFGSLDPTQAAPEELFYHPIWFVPFRERPAPLIASTPDQVTTAPLASGAVQVASGFPAHYLKPQEMAQFLDAVDPPPWAGDA